MSDDRTLELTVIHQGHLLGELEAVWRPLLGVGIRGATVRGAAPLPGEMARRHPFRRLGGGTEGPAPRPADGAAAGPAPPDAAAARADAAVAPVCSPTAPRPPPATLAIFPDQGEAPYVDVAASAERTLDVLIYLMGTGGVLDTLERKA